MKTDRFNRQLDWFIRKILESKYLDKFPQWMDLRMDIIETGNKLKQNYKPNFKKRSVEKLEFFKKFEISFTFCGEDWKPIREDKASRIVYRLKHKTKSGKKNLLIRKIINL